MEVGFRTSEVPARDLKATPTANYVVKYKKSETEQLLNGLVSCELSERTTSYGSSAWWVVLDSIWLCNGHVTAIFPDPIEGI